MGGREGDGGEGGGEGGREREGKTLCESNWKEVAEEPYSPAILHRGYKHF